MEGCCNKDRISPDVRLLFLPSNFYPRGLQQCPSHWNTYWNSWDGALKWPQKCFDDGHYCFLGRANWTTIPQNKVENGTHRGKDGTFGPLILLLLIMCTSTQESLSCGCNVTILLAMVVSELDFFLTTLVTNILAEASLPAKNASLSSCIVRSGMQLKWIFFRCCSCCSGLV